MLFIVFQGNNANLFLSLFLFQGYRDAHCLFMEMLVNKDTAASPSAYYGYSKSDYCLCLAIHAPRKGIVEVPFSCMPALLIWKDSLPEHFHCEKKAAA